jgi:hypothetical protein
MQIEPLWLLFCKQQIGLDSRNKEKDGEYGINNGGTGMPRIAPY